MSTRDRGFASMNRDKQREIASKGGKAAHEKGRAHEWTKEEAREAGRKGGVASQRVKREHQTPLQPQPQPMPAWAGTATPAEPAPGSHF
jgi:general stress protein YciG